MVFSSIDVGTYPCEPKAPNSSTSSNTDVCGRWLYIPESSAATGISFVPSSLVLRSWWPQILKEEQKNHDHYKGTTQINNWYMSQRAYVEIWSKQELWRARKATLASWVLFKLSKCIIIIWIYAQLKHGSIDKYNIFNGINALEQLT